METTNIYALIDPETGHVRYIGKANVVYKRFYSHKNDKRKNHRSNWIRLLKTKGLSPEIIIIDVVKKTEWQFWERHYISLFRFFGFDLTNKSDGGEGTEHTAETKRKMSELKKGKPVLHWQNRIVTPELRIKLGNASRGRKHSAEEKEKRASKLRGLKRSDETRMRQSMSLKGKVRLRGAFSSRAKPVILASVSGDSIINFGCLMDAAKFLGYTTETIRISMKNSEVKCGYNIAFS
jgi:group I intron endonuclease